MVIKYFIFILAVLFSSCTKISQSDNTSFTTQLIDYYDGSIDTDSIIQIIDETDFYFCVPKHTIDSVTGFIQFTSIIQSLERNKERHLVIYSSNEFESSIDTKSRFNGLGKINIANRFRTYHNMGLNIVFNPNTPDSIWLSSTESKGLMDLVVNMNEKNNSRIISNVSGTPSISYGIGKLLQLTPLEIFQDTLGSIYYYKIESNQLKTIPKVKKNNIMRIICDELDNFNLVFFQQDTILKTHSNRLTYRSPYPSIEMDNPE